jgi:hypothetical protein
MRNRMHNPTIKKIVKDMSACKQNTSFPLFVPLVKKKKGSRTAFLNTKIHEDFLLKKYTRYQMK